MLVVSTVMVPMVPSNICVDESRRPRARMHASSLCELCLRKLRQRIISSVVDCRRKPRAIRISSVVDCRLNIVLSGGRAQGLGSRLEHELDSGLRARPTLAHDACLRSRLRRLAAEGLNSPPPALSGLSWFLSRRGRAAESGLKESLLAFPASSGSNDGPESRRRVPGGPVGSSKAVACLCNLPSRRSGLAVARESLLARPHWVVESLRAPKPGGVFPLGVIACVA